MASKFGHKRPVVSNERRAVEASEVKVRPARNLEYLPNEYDDKPCARQPRSDRYKNKRHP